MYNLQCLEEKGSFNVYKTNVTMVAYKVSHNVLQVLGKQRIGNQFKTTSFYKMIEK